MTKNAVRKTVRTRRAGIDPERLAADSRRIAETVMQLPCFAGSQSVALYLAVNGEVQTERLLQACLQAGKRVFVPAFRGHGASYDFAFYGEPLARGPNGIPEPERPRWMNAAETVDLMIVPGVGFDPTGARVGHGGGHYDRLLKAVRVLLRVGVAFEWQVFRRVDVEPHDVSMDMVVTEKHIWSGGTGRRAEQGGSG